MRQPVPGCLALWDPTPRKDRDFDAVRIGDVGVFLEGRSHPLFNVIVEIIRFNTTDLELSSKIWRQMALI